ncbi:pyridine nucleotide-disulfide oxidoreductase family protein [Aspergillus crustosus]
MAKKLVIIGTGFGGLWSALSAKRLAKLTNKESQLEILIISPKPSVVIRPRLYEANAAGMIHDIGPLLAESGIGFKQGFVETINTDENSVVVRATAIATSGSDQPDTISYDRLILASGSSVVRPKFIPGIQEHAFDIDSIDAASRLEAHLKGLSTLPPSAARDTIVVCGAGFTGIEIATELPKRLTDPKPRIIVVESAAELGPELGPGPRPVITQALNELGIEYKLGAAVSSIDRDSITLSSGEVIDTNTAIWTAGVRASPLTSQIPAPKDGLSRLKVDTHLRIPSTPAIFATGDTASAAADTLGHTTLMSCQHAIPMGRVSGHNAAADLLNEPLVDYAQADYGTCLDLGAWGTVIAKEWERNVAMQGDLAKKVKGFINQRLIYPPAGVEEAIKLADPVPEDSLRLWDVILQAVA